MACGGGVSALSCFSDFGGGGGSWGAGLENIFREQEGPGEKSLADSAAEGALDRAPVRPSSGTEGGTTGRLVSQVSWEGR